MNALWGAMGKGVRRSVDASTGLPKGRIPKGDSKGDFRGKAGLRGQVAAVMDQARQSGLTTGKDSRIAGRVSSELIERAKARTGLQSDTELVEFALANIALDDSFIETFRAVKGTVDPDLDLEF
ncbi:hypothetical protein [Methylorubrum populi]